MKLWDAYLVDGRHLRVAGRCKLEAMQVLLMKFDVDLVQDLLTISEVK